MRFRLLGTVEADVAGRPLRLGWRQERFVLALLLLEAGRSVSAERLADLLWDGDPPAEALRTIRVVVSRLRARLTAAGSADHGVRLVTHGSGYALAVAPDQVDVHRFRRLVGEARGEADPARAVACLRAALALWRGPALAAVAGDGLRQRVAAPLEDELPRPRRRGVRRWASSTSSTTPTPAMFAPNSARWRPDATAESDHGLDRHRRPHRVRGAGGPRR